MTFQGSVALFSLGPHVLRVLIDWSVFRGSSADGDGAWSCAVTNGVRTLVIFVKEEQTLREVMKADSLSIHVVL